MQHKDEIIIKKMIAEINIGIDMLGDTSIEDFIKDEKLKRALSMTVINIGELVKNITHETRIVFPNIPWKAIAGMRDMTAHKYQTLRMEDVYYTIKNDFINLKKELENIK